MYSKILAAVAFLGFLALVAAGDAAQDIENEVQKYLESGSA